MKQNISTKYAVLLWLLFFLSADITAALEEAPVSSYRQSTGPVLQHNTAQKTAANSNDSSQANIRLPDLIYQSSEHFSRIDSVNLDGLLERIGDSRLVLLGEASHGTAEFYDMRARISQELIEKKGFTIVAVEADWPDATSINHYIRGPGHTAGIQRRFTNKPFSGFPSWMWANQSVVAFTRWLKQYNQSLNTADAAVDFYGLDFYNLYGSIEAVVDYLQATEPEMAAAARSDYACLMPWFNDPSSYSRDMQLRQHRGCGSEVFAVLKTLLDKRPLYSRIDQAAYFNALQNARLISNGEYYFRTLYDDNNNPWNQRDQNMFETLQAVLKYRGQSSKAIIWAHNSHIGDARATEMTTRGQFNLGQRVRETFADSAYLVGFGTDHGTVAAASNWLGAMKIMQVLPSHKDSYEHLFHEVKADNFLLPLRQPILADTRTRLLDKRLQRAIGTTYAPDNELKKHYSYASLANQFDEFIWFDETRAVKALAE